MLTAEQIKARKAYMGLLIHEAKKMALEHPERLLFDPQGRVLIDVALPEKLPKKLPEGIELPEDFKLQEGIELPEDKTTVTGLFQKGYPGHKTFKPSKVTTVSLDVTTDPDLAALKTTYRQKYELSEENLAELSSMQSSIIPLQQEYHFHLALATRTYAKVIEQKFDGLKSERQIKDALKQELAKHPEFDIKELRKKLNLEYQEKKTQAEHKRGGKPFDRKEEEEFRKKFLDAGNNETYKEILDKLEKKGAFIKEFRERFEKQIAQEKEKLEKQMAQAHQKAMARVQPLIEDAFKKAFADSNGNNVKLVKALDKARESIAEEAHSILMEEVVRATGKRVSKKDLSKKEVVHLAESTTATPNDILHTDGSSKLATWISGSENTAHERGIDTLADRQIATIALGNGYTPSRLQIRTPSLDVKKGIDKASAINDVSVKLTSLASKYAIKEVITEKKVFTNKEFRAKVNLEAAADIKARLEAAGIKVNLEAAAGIKARLEEVADIKARLEAADIKACLEEVAGIQVNLEKAAEINKDVFNTKPWTGKAFIYNLHTAINDGLGDAGGNKQSAGARIILSGAHLHNKAQLYMEAGVARPFCFVQNISVNGFGDSLGYGGNDLRTEATLMSEMAMLYNLVREDDVAKDQVQEVFAKYNAFLMEADAHPQKDLFFSASKQGKDAIELIKGIKIAWKDRVAEEVDQSNPVERAKAALKTMMANDLHHQHEYSKLIQALSIFIEEASISGCKSGNERAQAINGRVAILDHEAGQPDSEIFKAIDSIVNGGADHVLEHAASLKQQLDKQYDQRLQSGVSLVSDVDQGASAKVNAPKKMSWKHPWDSFKALFTNKSRNIAEESSLQYLSQGKAGNMQAHKGLTEYMADSWGAKGLGKFLGGWGIAACVLTVGVGLLLSLPFYGYSTYQSNKKIEAKISEAMDEFQTNNKDDGVMAESWEKMNGKMPRIEGADHSPAPRQLENGHGVTQDVTVKKQATLEGGTESTPVVQTTDLTI
ncbi:Uncharacterised protein [Legionella steigerwaltii]|uniref:Uncharacterized protein n=1 Tax=Legionella steigerwaltii TaxID=460 RepID=A0A378LKK5_9GAMM|nr:hypothetical protein [Legionella steigerwaltii]KTD79504.1 hypothetical protein Lstg_0720 [Legionella steigerwaltii]STY24611.1 Uncharacterised protein [Legionella steigerwaltii]